MNRDSSCCCLCLCCRCATHCVVRVLQCNCNVIVEVRLVQVQLCWSINASICNGPLHPYLHSRKISWWETVAPSICFCVRSGCNKTPAADKRGTQQAPSLPQHLPGQHTAYCAFRSCVPISILLTKEEPSELRHCLRITRSAHSTLP